MNTLDLIAGIFKPFADLVDNVHTSSEEKALLRNELTKITTEVNLKVLELEGKLVEAQSKVLTAEIQGESWLQQNWRPMTMVTFVLLIVTTWLGYSAPGLTEAMNLRLLDIVEIGLGGYVIGRSVEKVAVSLKDVLKK
jgi:hypothetical protein